MLRRMAARIICFLQKTEFLYKGYSDSISYKKEFTLEKGTCYIALSPFSKDDWGGNYTISVNCPARLFCNHKNNTSKWYSATYIDRGYRKYTCKTCGYTWKTVPSAFGYQIKYSTDKNMKKGVVTKQRIGGSKIHGDITKLARKNMLCNGSGVQEIRYERGMGSVVG